MRWLVTPAAWISASALWLAISPGAAQATNILSLEPAAQAVRVGGIAVFELKMDFSDLTLGGAVTVGFDPAILSLSSIAFNDLLPDDPDFRCPGSEVIPCPADPNFVSLGTFAGISGVHTIATLAFEVQAVGTSSVSLEIANSFSDALGSPLEVMLLEAVLFAAAADPSLLHESAAMGSEGQMGGAIIDAGQFLVARFHVDQTAEVEAIGGHLGSSGEIFGALIPLSGPDALPEEIPLDQALASTTFDAGTASRDFRTPLSATLEPGDYALVFGSGLFGAQGDGFMPENNADFPDASYFLWDGAGSDGGFENVRFVVALPEPTATLLQACALATLALLLRGRRPGAGLQ